VSSNQPLHFDDMTIIGENEHGWRFGVARLGSRWIGFATSSAYGAAARAAFRAAGLDPEPAGLFVFSQVADGFELGVADRDRAVLLTGAIAQDPEAGYGGVSRWHVPEALRGNPDDFRCPRCEQVGCDGAACDDGGGEYLESV